MVLRFLVFRVLSDVCVHVDHSLHTTLLASSLVSNGTVTLSEDQQTLQAVAAPTEAALLVAAHKFGLAQTEVRQRYPRVFEVPFNSSRKLQLTVHSLFPSSAGRLSLSQETKEEGVFGTLAVPRGATSMICVQGSPDRLLQLCKFALTSSGQVCALEAESAERREIMQQVDAYSSQALRVIAVAFAPIQNLPFDPSRSGTDPLPALCISQETD